MRFEEAERMFYRRCVSMGLSNVTIESYKNDFRAWKKYLLNNNITDISNMTPDDIMGYINYLREDCDLSPVTVADYFVALKALYNFLQEYDHIESNPFNRLKKPRIPKIKARTFTNGEVEKILSYFNKDTFVGYRNHVIMAMLFGTGMRRAELLRLTLMDIHLDEEFITVFGKGNKQRTVPVGASLKSIIRTYLKRRDEFLKAQSMKDSPSFIISRYGRPMAVSGLLTMFRKLKEDLNIGGKRFSPHTFRHTFAKNFLLNGGDIYSLQKILGHEDIVTTQIYLDFTDEELRAQYNKYNPLDNKRWTYY